MIKPKMPHEIATNILYPALRFHALKSHFAIATFLKRILSAATAASLHRCCQTLFRLTTNLRSHGSQPSSLGLFRFTKLLTKREVELPPTALNVLVEGRRIGRVGVQFGSSGHSGAGSRSGTDRGRTTATATGDCGRRPIRPGPGGGRDVRTAGRDATVPRSRRCL